MPTGEPTVDPTGSPTGSPSALVPALFIQVSGTIVFRGFSCEDLGNASMNIVPSFRNAFPAAVDDALSPNGVRIRNCTLLSPSDRRYLRRQLFLADFTSSLKWGARYQVPEGMSIHQAFIELKTKYSRAMSSGNFMAAFLSGLRGETSALSLLSWSMDEDYSVLAVSHAPTAAPTMIRLEGDVGGANIYDLKNNMAIVIPAAAVLFAILVFGAWFCWHRRIIKKKSELPQSRRPSPPLAGLKEFGANYASRRAHVNTSAVGGTHTPDKLAATHARESAALSNWLSALTGPDTRALESPLFLGRSKILQDGGEGSTQSVSADTAESSHSASSPWTDQELLHCISDQELLNKYCRDQLGYPARVEVPFIRYLLDFMQSNRLSKSQLQHLKFYYDSLVRENKKFVDILNMDACSPVKLNFGDYSPVGPEQSAKEDSFTFMGYDMLDLGDEEFDMENEDENAPVHKNAKSKRRVTFAPSPDKGYDTIQEVENEDDENCYDTLIDDVIRDEGCDGTLCDDHIDVMTPVRNITSTRGMLFGNPFNSDSKSPGHSATNDPLPAHLLGHNDIFRRSDIGNTPQLEGASPFIPGSREINTPSTATDSSTPTLVDTPPLMANLNYLSRHAAARNLVGQFRSAQQPNDDNIDAATPQKESTAKAASPNCPISPLSEGLHTPSTIRTVQSFDTPSTLTDTTFKTISPICSVSTLQPHMLAKHSPELTAQQYGHGLFRSRMSSKKSTSPSKRHRGRHSSSSSNGRESNSELSPLAAAAVAASRVISRGSVSAQVSLNEMSLSIAASLKGESPEQKWAQWTKQQNLDSSPSIVSTLSSAASVCEDESPPVKSDPLNFESDRHVLSPSALNAHDDGIDDCF